MLEKASKDDVARFQLYTIVNMQGKISTESDIDQFKLLNVKEQPLDNRLKYLDVMCFPVLFPNGQFGQYHPRTVQISHTEYVKSRLLNKDSRFRKDPQYVFYLLFQKQMRELSSGVGQYNLLNSTTNVSCTAFVQSARLGQALRVLAEKEGRSSVGNSSIHSRGPHELTKCSLLTPEFEFRERFFCLFYVPTPSTAFLQLKAMKSWIWMSSGTVHASRYNTEMHDDHLETYSK